MPTGVAIPDAKTQLYAAADRVVERDGVGALTSRSITEESGVAKGVLHRHFADFDTFLADYISWHIAQVNAEIADLLGAAGTRSVTDNLVATLTRTLTPLSLSMITVATSRANVRARLRDTTPYGIPLLAELTRGTADYLTAERDIGRISATADVATVALTLVGTAHLLFAGELGAQPDSAAVTEVVASITLPAEVH